MFSYKSVLMEKTLLAAVFVSLTLSGCGSWKRIGDLTMMASRNVDAKTNYQELSRYTSTEKRGYATMEEALDAAVAQVPGGEFMRNVQVYSRGNRVRVVGDVWGQRRWGSVAEQQAKEALGDQFRKGDKVVWKSGFFSRELREGKITSKDKTFAIVTYEDKNGQKQLDRIPYEKLSKRK
jgi:hypothetical protein